MMIDDICRSWALNVFNFVYQELDVKYVLGKEWLWVFARLMRLIKILYIVYQVDIILCVGSIMMWSVLCDVIGPGDLQLLADDVTTEWHKYYFHDDLILVIFIQ